MSEIEIRISTPDDGQYMLEWFKEPGVLRYFPMVNDQESEHAAKIWLSFARIEASFTAELDGVVCGTAVIYVQVVKKLAHQALFAIIIDRKMRGLGIGTKMMHYLMKVAKEKFKIETLHLEVYKGNPAKRLYDRLGFVEYGCHRRFLKEPSGEYLSKIVMQKEL